MGKQGLIYYSTLHRSKETQKGEKYPFLIAFTTIAKRIHWRRQQQESSGGTWSQQNSSEVTMNVDLHYIAYVILYIIVELPYRSSYGMVHPTRHQCT